MSTKEELLDILSEYIDVPSDEIDFDANMKMAAGINSFVFMSMVSAIEERFKLRISNEDMLTFKTLGDIVRYLEEHAS